MLDLSIHNVRPPARHEALDLAQPRAARLPETLSERVDALDLSASLAQRHVATAPAHKALVANLRTPASPTYAKAFAAAAAYVEADETYAGALAFNSLGCVAPQDYRAHAQYGFLMEQLAVAQDEASSIGRVHVSQPREGTLLVASERLAHLDGMLEGFLAYIDCLTDPEISARITERNGAEAVENGLVESANKIVWATMQTGAFVNAMAGAVGALAMHQGIEAARNAGELDTSNPRLRAMLDEHDAALAWPHLPQVKGEIAVSNDVAATVAAWNTWRQSACLNVYARIAGIRPALGELLPEPSRDQVLAQLDRLAQP